MKKIYFCLSLLLFPLLSTAQSKIAYTYDAAGNRVKREIIMQAPKAKAKRQTINTERQAFSDMLHEHSVKIYPNPTDGFLKVCISGLKGTDKCSLGIYTTQGAQIMTDDMRTDNFDIDISSQPTGIYLLRITINNSSTTWKIIKNNLI